MNSMIRPHCPRCHLNGEQGVLINYRGNRMKTYYMCTHCGGKFRKRKAVFDEVNDRAVKVEREIQERYWDDRKEKFRYRRVVK